MDSYTSTVFLSTGAFLPHYIESHDRWW